MNWPGGAVISLFLHLTIDFMSTIPAQEQFHNVQINSNEILAIFTFGIE